MKNLIQATKKEKKKYIYMQYSARLKKFLNKIQTINVPEKLTCNYLVKLGFRSASDKKIVSIMKALGFISPDKIPTQRWRDYRIKEKAKYVLAEGIREHYAELYKMSPTVHDVNNRELNNFFKGETDLGDATINYMISTFNALKELADFEAEKPAPEEEIEEAKREITEEKKFPTLEIPSIQINTHIHLSPEATLEQIDKIFESIAKYILFKKNKK